MLKDLVRLGDSESRCISRVHAEIDVDSQTGYVWLEDQADLQVAYGKSGELWKLARSRKTTEGARLP